MGAFGLHGANICGGLRIVSKTIESNGVSIMKWLVAMDAKLTSDSYKRVLPHRFQLQSENMNPWVSTSVLELIRGYLIRIPLFYIAHVDPLDSHSINCIDRFSQSQR